MPEGVGMCVLLCVLFLTSQATEAGVWKSLSVGGTWATSSSAGGVEGPWTMAVGMAPACLAFERALLLRIPGSRPWCH